MLNAAVKEATDQIISPLDVTATACPPKQTGSLLPSDLRCSERWPSTDRHRFVDSVKLAGCVSTYFLDVMTLREPKLFSVLYSAPLSARLPSYFSLFR